MLDKVAVVAAVGNEDDTHKISRDLFQALNDVGFTLPAQAATYRNGEAMHTTDYNDLERTPEKVSSTTRSLAAQAAHLARALKASGYPAS